MKRTPKQIALHSLQAEFMRDKPAGEWFALPGGTHEGNRIPDSSVFVGCWFSRPLDTAPLGGRS